MDTITQFALKKDNIPIGYIKVNGDKTHELGYGLKVNFGIMA